MSTTMDTPPRLACVSLPSFGLQALRRRPGVDPEAPLALIDRGGSQGRVVAVNQGARRSGVRVGLRAAAASGLCPALRLATLEEEELDAATAAIVDALDRFSPRIEPGPPGSGAFWIDPAGMGRLYGPPRAWAEAIRAHLGDLGWRAAIVVGFGRFLTRALAEGSARVRVLATPAEEIDAAAAVPLARLDLPRRRLSDLAALEVHTLGDLLRLPAAELRARFGREVADLHAQASGARWDPLRPRARREAITATLVVDPPESVDERLLFAIKGILPGLLDRLAAAGERAAAVDLRLELDRAEAIDLRIAAAEPTDDLLQLLDLIRLRLGALSLPAPVAELTLTLDGVRPERPQIGLLADKPRRDVTAAARALERIRAAYGDAAVTRASLRQAHLPEASFAWEPVQAVALPHLPAVAANMSESTNAMIRRLLRRPVPLGEAAPEDERSEDDADDSREPPPPPSLAGVMPPTCGAIRRLHGPYRVSGGWWVRAVERDYYYAETTGGELLWLFFDRPRRRWFLHGVVD